MREKRRASETLSGLLSTSAEKRVASIAEDALELKAGDASAVAVDADDEDDAMGAADLPERWKWITKLIDQAHLPLLGLPVEWKKTQDRHIKTAFDPESKRTFDLTDSTSKILKSSPVGFISSTRNKNPMPGTQTPDAVRYDLYMHPEMQSHLVIDAHGNKLVPCLAHGDYVQVAALQSDHAHDKANILQRQQELVTDLNEKPDFAKFVMSLEGMNKFFVYVEAEKRYFGTLFFYELFFNDIDNLWLICEACNLHKSDHDTFKWLQEQWLFGGKFLEYIGREQSRDQTIIMKTKSGEGLATVILKWFWENHANYISISQKLLQDVSVPIQILNRKIDYVAGKGQQKRMERLQASLDFRMGLLSIVAKMPGIAMPRRDSESLHASSDDESYAKVITPGGSHQVKVSHSVYEKSTKEVIAEAPSIIQSLLHDKLRKNEMRGAHDSSSSSTGTSTSSSPSLETVDLSRSSSSSMHA